MNKFEALVSLNMVGEIGSIRLKKLLEYFNQPQDILEAPQEKLMSIAGIGGKIAHKIHTLKKEDLDKELKLAKRHDVKIITQDNSEYPLNLKYIPDPPTVLYVKGELLEEDNLAIAIVGSRRASIYGLNSAEKFAYNLSEKGFTIISGMARGIDTYAHKGALKRKGRTLAVIGSGFNQLYPPENKKLAQEISQNGAIISEFPFDMQPLPANFPQRNRVISGLSLGVLVVEAARNSGALITADFALEQGREVFALPGEVDSLNSFGTNSLIKQGAKLVLNIDDIIEELPYTLSENLALFSPEQKDTSKELNSEEAFLYNLISAEPLGLDELIEKSGLDIPQATNELLGLQIKKLIRQLPGEQFIRS